MKAIRATFVFVLLISFLTIPLKSIAQECNGEYNITATFDANGNKVQTDYGNGKILVVSTNFGGGTPSKCCILGTSYTNV